MCKRPEYNPVTGVTRACRNCSECKGNQIQDWVGRCIAESKTVPACHVVTLTYGRGDDHIYTNAVDHWNARVLVYRDVQHYLKRLRYNGYPLRYFCTGEYGTAKGRAHWHMVCFWLREPPPNLRLRERYDHALPNGNKLWDHGWSYWDDCTPKAVNYVCKYIAQDLKDEQAQLEWGMSTKPALGSAYFESLALLHVQQGLSPQTLLYTHPECTYRQGKLQGQHEKFMLTGSSAYNYLDAFERIWWQHHNRHYPYSAIMDAYIDERDRRERRRLGETDIPEEEFPARLKLTMEERKGKCHVPLESVATAVERMLKQQRQEARHRQEFGLLRSA